MGGQYCVSYASRSIRSSGWNSPEPKLRDFFRRTPAPILVEVKPFEFRADAIGQLLLYAMAKDVPDNVRLRIHLFSVPNRGRRDREKLAAFIALCERLEIEVTCEPATECQA